ncbi:hypothetical protein QYZ45_17560 [Vibrio parahaemolyticus]|nr:hypothetical protein [Vibrio parahaemolyticus]
MARPSIQHAAVHFSARQTNGAKYGYFYTFTKGFARYGGARGEENAQTTIGHTHSITLDVNAQKLIKRSEQLAVAKMDSQIAEEKSRTRKANQKESSEGRSDYVPVGVGD